MLTHHLKAATTYSSRYVIVLLQLQE